MTVVASALTFFVAARGEMDLGCRATSLRLSLWSPTVQASPHNAAAWMRAQVPEGVCSMSMNNVNSLINCTDPICISAYRMAFLGPITADDVQWTIEASLRNAVGMDSWLTLVEGGPTLASASTVDGTAPGSSTYAIGVCPESQRCQGQPPSDTALWLADSEGSRFANWNMAVHLSATNFALSEVSIADTTVTLARVLEVDENQIRVQEAQVSMLSADSAQLDVRFHVAISAEVPSSSTVVLTEDVQAAIEEAMHMGHRYVQAEADRVISRCGAMGGDPQMFEQVFVDVAGTSHLLRNTPVTRVTITHPAQAAPETSVVPHAVMQHGPALPLMQAGPTEDGTAMGLTPVFEVVSGIQIEFFDSADFDWFSSQQGQPVIWEAIAHFLGIPTSQGRVTGVWGAPELAGRPVQAAPPSQASLFVDFVVECRTLEKASSSERSLSPPTAGLLPPAVAAAGPPATNVAGLYQRLVLSAQARGMELRFRQVAVVPGSTQVRVTVPGLAPPPADPPAASGSSTTVLLLLGVCVLSVAVISVCSCGGRGEYSERWVQSVSMEEGLSPREYSESTLRDGLSPRELSPRDLSFSPREFEIASSSAEEERRSRARLEVAPPVEVDGTPRTRALVDPHAAKFRPAVGPAWGFSAPSPSPLDAEASTPGLTALSIINGMAPPQLSVRASGVGPGNPLMAAAAARSGAFVYAPL